MPKTKFQNFIFTVMMALVMVYAMICYNISLETALQELKIMWPLAVALELFVYDRLSKKLAFRFVTPGKDSPIFVILSVSSMIVCLMCPSMSLAAALLFKHPGSEAAAVWLQTTVMNFPMALCWQIFFCGPFVRLVFRRVFRKQLK